MHQTNLVVVAMLGLALSGCVADPGTDQHAGASASVDQAPAQDPFFNLTFSDREYHAMEWFNGSFAPGDSYRPLGSGWAKANQHPAGRAMISVAEHLPLNQLVYIAAEVEVEAQGGSFDLWLNMPGDQVYMWRNDDDSPTDQGFEAVVRRTSDEFATLVVAYNDPDASAQVPYTVRFSAWAGIEWLPEAIPVEVPLMGENATVIFDLWTESEGSSVLVYDPSDEFLGRAEADKDGRITFVRTAEMRAGPYVFMLPASTWASRVAVDDPDQEYPEARVLRQQVECCEAQFSSGSSLTWEFTARMVPLQVGIAWSGGAASRDVSAELRSPGGQKLSTVANQAGLQIDPGWAWTQTPMGGLGLERGRYEAEVVFAEYHSDEPLEAFQWVVYYQR